MVAALACTVIGAVRTKVKITPRSVTLSRVPEPLHAERPVVTGSSRECKLFSDLCEYLATAPSAYAILDSTGRVDIESMGWTAVPPEIKTRAVEIAQSLIQSGRMDPWEGMVDGWRVAVKFIGEADGKFWCLLTIKTNDPIHAANIAHEATRLLLLFPR
jgi:hypothetical protein